MAESVAVFGGGVAGLNAAHELAKRGFRVRVYERKLGLGGKARSIPVPHSGTGGRLPLPGEHGFRFFPGFYKHVTDTMRRIPYGAHGSTYDNLQVATRPLLVRAGQTERMPWCCEEFERHLGTFASDGLREPFDSVSACFWAKAVLARAAEL